MHMRGQPDNATTTQTPKFLVWLQNPGIVVIIITASASNSNSVCVHPKIPVMGIPTNATSQNLQNTSVSATKAIITDG
jgi:hypothetical protein